MILPLLFEKLVGNIGLIVKIALFCFLGYALVNFLWEVWVFQHNPAYFGLISTTIAERQAMSRHKTSEKLAVWCNTYE